MNIVYLYRFLSIRSTFLNNKVHQMIHLISQVYEAQSSSYLIRIFRSFQKAQNLNWGLRKQNCTYHFIIRYRGNSIRWKKKKKMNGETCNTNEDHDGTIRKSSEASIFTLPVLHVVEDYSSSFSPPKTFNFICIFGLRWWWFFPNDVLLSAEVQFSLWWISIVC